MRREMRNMTVTRWILELNNNNLNSSYRHENARR